jgi:hypothetical protein
MQSNEYKGNIFDKKEPNRRIADEKNKESLIKYRTTKEIRPKQFQPANKLTKSCEIINTQSKTIELDVSDSNQIESKLKKRPFYLQFFTKQFHHHRRCQH